LAQKEQFNKKMNLLKAKIILDARSMVGSQHAHQRSGSQSIYSGRSPFMLNQPKRAQPGKLKALVTKL